MINDMDDLLLDQAEQEARRREELDDLLLDQAEQEARVPHWVLSRDRVQTIITNLDRNLMSLASARDYFSAYDVQVPGRSRAAFIRNLCKMVNDQ